MEPKARQYVSRFRWETESMNRSVAFRAFLIFSILAALAGVTVLASHVAIAGALALIAGSVSALMLVIALASPSHDPVPARIHRRR